MAQQPLVGQGFLIIKASPSPLETPYTVGLLWTSDKPDAESFQHTTFSRDKTSMIRWDSNPQSQQASDRRPTPLTERPLAG